MDESLVIHSLRECALFAGVSDAALGEVARHLRRRRFRRNEVIFHQGDPGDSLHIVTSGAVKVVLPSAEGEEAIIATLRPGDFFGELSLLDGAPRSATVVALDSAETMALPRTAFLELLDATPACAMPCLAGLAHELRRLTSHVEELHFLDLAGRLAMRLSRLARDADPVSKEVRLDWPYTQSGPGGHDRRHAPEREQAAQRPRGRRPGGDRARHAHHPRRGRAGAAGGALDRGARLSAERQVRLSPRPLVGRVPCA